MTACSFAVRILLSLAARSQPKIADRSVAIKGSYLLDRWGSPCSEGDRHVAARGRTVHDFPRRRAAPCRNVSASTVLLDRIALLVVEPNLHRNFATHKQVRH